MRDEIKKNILKKTAVCAKINTVSRINSGGQDICRN